VLAMTSVIVEKMCFYLLSNLLYSSRGAPKRCRAWDNFPLLSLSMVHALITH